MDRWTKDAFVVIGKAGSTRDGAGVVQRLWAEANDHFAEVADLAVQPLSVWGVMSDFDMQFLPWSENFSQGAYLAGVECHQDAEAPEGWTKWLVPGFEYARMRYQDEQTFAAGLELLKAEGLPLVGAVQEYTDPASGESFLLFPVRRL